MGYINVNVPNTFGQDGINLLMIKRLYRNVYQNLSGHVHDYLTNINEMTNYRLLACKTNWSNFIQITKWNTLISCSSKKVLATF